MILLSFAFVVSQNEREGRKKGKSLNTQNKRFKYIQRQWIPTHSTHFEKAQYLPLLSTTSHVKCERENEKEVKLSEDEKKKFLQ